MTTYDQIQQFRARFTRLSGDFDSLSASILTISGAVLGFSIAFLSNAEFLEATVLLKAAWIALGLVIFLNIGNSFLKTTETASGSAAHEISKVRISFMSIGELNRRIASGEPEVHILDIREADAYASGHIPGALHLPRGQLELRVDSLFPDPTVRILTYCEFGKISTIAAGTLHDMGFLGAIALDGGIDTWKESGYPLETGTSPD